MYDQLIIGEKASFDDFDASLKERHISAPAKKSIKETVPFSNYTYDFSAINGEVYWDERELEYIFEIIAFTPEELESKKTAFSNWVMNVMEESIHDPFEPDWHYQGTFDGIEYEDDESLMKTTITVVFLAYPYKIANGLTAYSFEVPGSTTIQSTIVNESSHRITPKLIADTSLILQIGNMSYTVPAGEVTDYNLTFQPGATVMSITNQSETESTLSVEYYVEVF